MTKKISWLLPLEPSCPQDLTNCTIASVRLRAATVLDVISGSNLSIEFSSLPALDSRLLVVGKVGGDCDRSGRGSLWLAAINDYICSGRPVVIDYTDNHLDLQGAMNRFYAQIPNHQHVHWVVPSLWLLESLSKRGFQNIYVINDAFEVPAVSPRSELIAGARGLHVLWFGHPSNLPYLAQFLAQQVSPESESFVLHIVSGGFNPSPLLEQLKNLPFINDAISYDWSVKNLVNVAKSVDLCLLPGNPFDPRKAGVGVNRLVTALALGLPTMASQYSSYSQLKDYFLEIPISGPIKISSDIPSLLTPLLARDQASILREYSLHALGHEWLGLLDSLVK